jgi:Fe/S biogenesis protein NfuA
MTSMSDIVADRDTLLTVTPAAREVVLGARADELDAASLALWLEVNVGVGGTFGYDMYFQPRSESTAGDEIVDLGDGLEVVVPSASVDRLRGATLDIANGGMVLLNPNEPAKTAPAMSVAPTGSLDGPIAARILEVIETQVNPGIASHGGFATLVSVDGDTAFITMGGGCQGCASSKATLRQGIEVRIKQAVPEIANVVDVTDHQAGANPYYK